MTDKVFFPSLDGIQLCALLQETSQTARGAVVLGHGITVDKDESGDSVRGIGAFVELAEALTAAGYNVLRFDYRGHGESALDSTQMTIAGEVLDLIASVDQARARWQLPTAVLGASFAGISSVFYAAHYALPCLVLWNPVLDPRRTFLEPLTPKPKAFFNPAAYETLKTEGYLSLEGFKLGPALIEEMKTSQPYALMDRITCPVLTLHGDRDEYVPYAVSEQYARCNDRSEFVSVPGALHGFQTPEDRAFVIGRTLTWLEQHLH